ncbi:UDP-N-acetylmuramoyl-L-alanyl-D-glutamate--2,6-diaminopimelate ligase [Thaumasiovibrio subtropicus]|uniref:UDP-N-acetylmuramoyl-L-alanyl-D-glutamate--2, 6-diaminopimelate ligase n=1 Tax=Thaumasiovibrio subtropicus TaxID=1891207 RepID=UPI000B3567E7|nr:UDP-N-acetylmuramoyl-L-alanyl-D-glutamate--2,6-diaminopimelate ligase [Thaumasiovibrio subtropicus]
MPTVKTANLGELLAPWIEAQDSRWASIAIKEMQIDSRQVQVGDLFVAMIGHQVDGNQFISTAIESGASAVLSHVKEADCHGIVEWVNNVPVIRVFQLDHHLSAIAQRGYFNDSDMPTLVGVTGTNGKTTITQLIAQWLELQDVTSGVMGTTGNGLLNEIEAATNTTGSAIEIQSTLAKLQQLGAKTVALEVSSHGLVQHRVAATPFRVGVFTNLSRDHLDYHGDMASYADAKKTLFTTHDTQAAVINIDDPIGAQWANELPDAIVVSSSPDYSTSTTHRYVFVDAVVLSSQGMTLSVRSSWGQGELCAPLVGEFNVNNLLLALATLLEMRHDLTSLLDSAPRLTAVIGRMEVFHQADKPMLVVDYAHTPDALEKALQALRGHCDGNLWCIVGCGGDRDKGKRPMMAAAAESYADFAVFTDDNPRSEEPAAIVRDMLEGVRQKERVVVKHDRADAIGYAFTHANARDIVLVAGKGHEDYQVFADRTVHYSDRETVQTLLELPS